MGKFYKRSLLSLLFFLPFFCWSQTIFPAQVGNDSGREKLYIHFDKNNYVLGDTIWYKTYLVDAQSNISSEKSGIVYIEFLDPKNDLVKRYTHHNVLGISNGFIPTDTAYSSSGIYRIRAYTRWMRNFGDSLFFEKEIQIADSRILDKWFLSIHQPKVLGDSVVMGLRFTDDRNRPLRNKAADFYLLGERNRVAIHDRLQLDNDGSINVNFSVPEKFRDGPLYVRITDVGNKRAVRVNAPFDISGKDLDVQFLPESGHLLSGIENRVGFKALGSSGLGVDVKGVVKDDLGKEVAIFRSIHKGMGVFLLKPEADRVYTAYLNDGKQVPLPKVEDSGTVLQVMGHAGYPKEKAIGGGITASENQAKEEEEQDGSLHQTMNIENEIRFRIIATANLANQQYYLMCRSKGNTFHQQEIEYKNTPVEIVLPRALFPSGVSSLVLLSQNGKVLNERAIFVEHKDGLDIQIETTQGKYGLRDSIPLKIIIKDRFGNPVMGSFSLAVTDTRQVEKDPKTDGNIRSYLLMQSELMGNIENPNYYFNQNHVGVVDSIRDALDVLLLTQGFVRYDWDSTRFVHKAEKEYTVSGKVIKGFKGTTPIVGTKVVLFSSKKFPTVLQTVTDSSGRFLFKNIPSFDTTSFVLQARSFKGRSFNVELKPDYFYPATLSKRILTNSYSDRVFINRDPVNKVAPEAVRYIRHASEAGLLNIVEIMGKRTIPGSKNLNGSGNADQVFTQEDIKKMPNMNIYEFLKMNIKGYIPPWGTEEQRMNEAAMVQEKSSSGAQNENKKREGGIERGGVKEELGVKVIDGIIAGIERERNEEEKILGGVGKVGNRPVYFYIDGVSASWPQYGPVNLELLRSENIKGVEVMDNTTYTYRYNVINGNLGARSKMTYLSNTVDEPPIFIEVTTVSGIGTLAFVEQTTPGVETYRPPIFYYGKEFYSPRYTTVTERDEPLPDLRSTLYWNPLIITNEDGEAAVDFYSADSPANYLIVLEGIDLKGGIGAAYRKIEVQK